MNVLKKLAASRKVAIALASLIPAVCAEFGVNVSEDLVFRVLAIGALLITGIAVEDAAAKFGLPPTATPASPAGGSSVK